MRLIQLLLTMRERRPEVLFTHSQDLEDLRGTSRPSPVIKISLTVSHQPTEIRGPSKLR